MHLKWWFWPNYYIEAELLLKQADAAMCQAKLRGRNRIMFAKPEDKMEQETFV